MRPKRLRALAAEFFHRLVGPLRPSERPEIWAPLRTAFADGFRLLAIRVEAQGLSAQAARAQPSRARGALAFHRLARDSDRLMDAWRAGEDVSAPARCMAGALRRVPRRNRRNYHAAWRAKA